MTRRITFTAEEAAKEYRVHYRGGVDFFFEAVGEIGMMFMKECILRQIRTGVDWKEWSEYDAEFRSDEHGVVWTFTRRRAKL